MTLAWLSLGSNLDDPAAQLAEAVGRLRQTPGLDVVAQSSLLRTVPWGKIDQPEFVNMAVAVDTDMKPRVLLEACLAIERAMGRERIEKWGPRRIDIDIVAYGREIIEAPDLAIPHPFAHERDFVLDPLREIAPEVVEWLKLRASTAD